MENQKTIKRHEIYDWILENEYSKKFKPASQQFAKSTRTPEKLYIVLSKTTLHELFYLSQTHATPNIYDSIVLGLIEAISETVKPQRLSYIFIYESDDFDKKLPDDFEYDICQSISSDNKSVLVKRTNQPLKEAFSFIQKQRLVDGYTVNTSHVLYANEAEALLFALASHELGFILMRNTRQFHKKRHDRLTFFEQYYGNRIYKTNIDDQNSEQNTQEDGKLNEYEKQLRMYYNIKTMEAIKPMAYRVPLKLELASLFSMFDMQEGPLTSRLRGRQSVDPRFETTLKYCYETILNDWTTLLTHPLSQMYLDEIPWSLPENALLQASDHDTADQVGVFLRLFNKAYIWTLKNTTPVNYMTFNYDLLPGKFQVFVDLIRGLTGKPQMNIHNVELPKTVDYNKPTYLFIAQDHPISNFYTQCLHDEVDEASSGYFEASSSERNDSESSTTPLAKSTSFPDIRLPDDKEFQLYGTIKIEDIAVHNIEVQKSPGKIADTNPESVEEPKEFLEFDAYLFDDPPYNRKHVLNDRLLFELDTEDDGNDVRKLHRNTMAPNYTSRVRELEFTPSQSDGLREIADSLTSISVKTDLYLSDAPTPRARFVPRAMRGSYQSDDTNTPVARTFRFKREYGATSDCGINDSNITVPEPNGLTKSRERLPAYKMFDEVIWPAIESSQVTIVIGKTGSGKTTQVPQLILDREIERGNLSTRIVVTEPRRIATMNVAKRVAAERGEKDLVSRDGYGSVGYQIKLERCAPRQNCSLYFVTPGIALEWLKAKCTYICNASYIVIDEVHERELNTDIFVCLIKQLLTQRPNLKVVLMSATINAQLFCDYFGGAAIVNVPGQLFDVDEIYLEDLQRDGVDISVKHENDPDMQNTIDWSFSKTIMEPIFKKQNQPAELLKITAETDGSGVSSEAPLCDGDYDTEWERGSPVYRVDPIAARDELMLHEAEYVYDYYRDPTNGPPLDRQKVEELMKYEYVVKNVYPDETVIVRTVEYFIKQTAPTEAVMIFINGKRELKRIADRIQSMLGSTYELDIHMVHSAIDPVQQARVFETAAEGVRKIIVTTPVCETSVTIEDVACVIDCGVANMIRCDTELAEQILEQRWISKANATQRRGRAGRTKKGTVIRLYTKARFEQLMDKDPIPDVQCTQLDSILLKMFELEVCQGNPQRILKLCMSPPQPENVKMAIDSLTDIGAIAKNKITPLGRQIAKFGMELKEAKMVVYAQMFGCNDTIVSLISAHHAMHTWLGFGMRSALQNILQQIPGPHNESYFFLMLKIFIEYEKYTTSRRFGSRKNNSCIDHETWSQYFKLPMLRLMMNTKEDIMSRLNRSVTGMDGGNFRWRSFFERNKNELLKIEQIISASLMPNVVHDVKSKICALKCFCVWPEGKHMASGTDVSIRKGFNMTLDRHVDFCIFVKMLNFGFVNFHETKWQALGVNPVTIMTMLLFGDWDTAWTRPTDRSSKEIDPPKSAGVLSMKTISFGIATKDTEIVRLLQSTIKPRLAELITKLMSPVNLYVSPLAAEINNVFDQLLDLMITPTVHEGDIALGKMERSEQDFAKVAREILQIPEKSATGSDNGSGGDDNGSGGDDNDGGSIRKPRDTEFINSPHKSKSLTSDVSDIQSELKKLGIRSSKSTSESATSETSEIADVAAPDQSHQKPTSSSKHRFYTREENRQFLRQERAKKETKQRLWDQYSESNFASDGSSSVCSQQERKPTFFDRVRSKQSSRGTSPERYPSRAEHKARRSNQPSESGDSLVSVASSQVTVKTKGDHLRAIYEIQIAGNLKKLNNKKLSNLQIERIYTMNDALERKMKKLESRESSCKTLSCKS